MESTVDVCSDVDSSSDGDVGWSKAAGADGASATECEPDDASSAAGDGWSMSKAATLPSKEAAGEDAESCASSDAGSGWDCAATPAGGSTARPDSLYLEDHELSLDNEEDDGSSTDGDRGWTEAPS